MFTIQLNQLRFFAYHGIHEEEKILGNEFDLSLHVNYQPQQLPVVDLEATVDYTVLYELVKKYMQVPTPLLETVVSQICKEVLEQFPSVLLVSCTLTKLHPPVAAIQGSLGVSLTLQRNA